MNDGFWTDPDHLTNQAGQFTWLAEQAGAIHRELNDALAETGPCWGSDSVGQSFASAHADPADATLGRLGSLPDQLGSVGSRFTDTAAGYRGSDTAGVERLSSADAPDS